MKIKQILKKKSLIMKKKTNNEEKSKILKKINQILMEINLYWKKNQILKKKYK